MAHRNAASVLPEPVGALIRVVSPRAIGGQPSTWGGVGSPNARSNHSRTGGEKYSSAAGIPAKASEPQHLPMILRPVPVTVRSEVLEKLRAARHSEAPASRLLGGISVSMTVRVPLTCTASTSA